VFERVHVVWDLYDGVRTGLANFHGAPYYFKCIFKDGDYTESFELQTVDPDLFEEAREQWAIYRAWERRFHGGEVALETHPGHGGFVPRYDELERSIKGRLASILEVPVVARAQFRAVERQPELPDGCLRELEVLWTTAA
jgi:hypothetical protein